MESVLMVRTAASAPTSAPFRGVAKLPRSVLSTVNVIVNFGRKKFERERANDKG